MMTVHFAETLFRWLMRAYPARFRRTHGLALFELFRDEARDAHAARGTIGLVLLLARTAVDTLIAAPGAWIRPGFAPTPDDELPPSPTDRRRFGGQDRPWLDWSSYWQDVRIALRHLRKSPGFTIVAVTTLAVGIGTNTTIFSLLNAVLLRPLATLEPDRVVRVVARTGSGAVGAAARRFSYRDFVDYREGSTTLEDLSGVNLATLLLTADNRTDQLIGEIASARYLPLRGIRVSQGRLLSDADDRPEAPPVAVISDALWRRRFGAEPIVGRQVLMNRATYTIVGVAEPSAIGSFIAAPVDVWLPIESSGTALGSRWNVDRTQRTLAVMGRLRPGVTSARAQAELQLIANTIAREFGREIGDGGRTTRSPTSVPAAPNSVGPVIDVLPGTLATGDQRRLAQMFLTLLLGLVALVLVIACANVGNLLLARVLGRRRELAIRLALGASRGRLARMLAVEGALIAAAGGAGALILSNWTGRALANISPLPTLTLRLDIRSDLRVVAFTALAALAAAVILAVVGTLQAMKPDIAPALKEDTTASIGGRRPARLRGALATVQITVSVLLVIGAALFVRSVREAGAIDLGFDPRGVVVLDVDASAGRTNTESLQMFHEVLQRVERLRGVTAAAVSSRAPLDSSTPLIHVNAHEPIATAGEAASPTASFMVVSARYFDVVKTPLASGRAFAETDDADRPAVAIVNETLATHLWPDADAVGRRLWVEAAATTGIRDEGVRGAVPCVVIGVAKDSKYRTLGEQRQGHVYLPFAQQPRRGMAILVRAVDPLDRVASAVQSALGTVDPNVQGFFTRTLTEHVAVSTLPVRFAAGLAHGVAALAVALSLIGLYSLVSFLVVERTHEIGLRKALGADTVAVLRLVAGHGIKLALLGLAVGVPAAIASTRLLQGLLYGVSPTDPVVFVGVSIAILVVATVACCVPARRAIRVDPLVALRSE